MAIRTTWKNKKEFGPPYESKVGKQKKVTMNAIVATKHRLGELDVRIGREVIPEHAGKCLKKDYIPK